MSNAPDASWQSPSNDAGLIDIGPHCRPPMFVLKRFGPPRPEPLLLRSVSASRRPSILFQRSGRAEQPGGLGKISKLAMRLCESRLNFRVVDFRGKLIVCVGSNRKAGLPCFQRCLKQLAPDSLIVWMFGDRAEKKPHPNIGIAL